MRYNVLLAGAPDSKIRAAIALIDKRMRAVAHRGGATYGVYTSADGERCFVGPNGKTLVAFHAVPR